MMVEVLAMCKVPPLVISQALCQQPGSRDGLLIKQGMNDLARLTLAGISGVATIQLCGILNLLLGAGLNRWTESLPDLLYSYSLGPLLAQLALCVAIALIALPIRRLLWIE